MMIRTAAAAGLALALLAAGGVQAAADLSKAARAGPPKFDDRDLLADAVNSSTRSAQNKARDPGRKPLESLTFWGVQAGDTMIELAPGGGYWTEILAPFAKATGGKFIGTGADRKDPATTEGQKRARAEYETRYGVETVDFGKNSGPLAPAGTVDFVLTARSVHGWIWRGELDKVLADSFAALKPGGVLALEQHRSDPRPMVAEARDGYVAESYVIAAAEKAGFRIDGRSEINANPKDSKDHPFGVWTLPPAGWTAPAGQPPNPAFDRTRYDAIGESDRMTLRFRKPG